MQKREYVAPGAHFLDACPAQALLTASPVAQKNIMDLDWQDVEW